jgi:hypothetical protein
MKRPDEQVLRAFEALKPNGYQQRIVEWLKESLAEERESLDSKQDIELAWGQGHAQVLKELLDVMESAGKNLAAIKAAKDRPRPTV